MPVPTLLATAAAVLGLASAAPYLVSILRGNTKPSRTTYAIWLVLDVINLASLIAIGGGGGVPLQAMLTSQGILWVALSVKYGVWAPSWIDGIVAGVAALAIGAWAVSGPGAALVSASIALTAGYAATLSKLSQHPLSENRSSWTLVALAASLSIAATALTNPALPALLLPIITFTGSMSIVVITLIQQQRRKRQKPVR